jgi:hypothetical protein
VAREQRKLAAILAADVVGYSRLMGRDESGTLARLREHRKERLEAALARDGGQLVKLISDLCGDRVNVAAWLGSQIRRTLNTSPRFAPLRGVLRIGKGVEEGGWDYGKDALRALALVACVFSARYAR